MTALLHLVIDTAHSRFPVYEGDKENIIGILMAKDLLKLQRAPELNIRALLRPAVFVPETKGLNDLLRDFRGNRNHLAIVIDEFGRTAGLITIEDVLEQIVGEIEDEFDVAEDEGDIFGLPDRSFRVSGDTAIERIEEAFGVKLDGVDPDESFDTIGGLIAHEMGHVPKRGEHHRSGRAQFRRAAHQGRRGALVQGLAGGRPGYGQADACRPACGLGSFPLSRCCWPGWRRRPPWPCPGMVSHSGGCRS